MTSNVEQTTIRDNIVVQLLHRLFISQPLLYNLFNLILSFLCKFKVHKHLLILYPYYI